MDKDIRTKMENILKRVEEKQREERIEIDCINKTLDKLLTDEEYYPLSRGYAKVFKPLIDKVNNGEFGRLSLQKDDILGFMLDFTTFVSDMLENSLNVDLIRGYIASDLQKANNGLSARIEFILEAFRGFTESPRQYSDLDLGALFEYLEGFYKGVVALDKDEYDEYNKFLVLSYFENRLLYYYQNNVFFEIHELVMPAERGNNPE